MPVKMTGSNSLRLPLPFDPDLDAGASRASAPDDDAYRLILEAISRDDRLLHPSREGAAKMLDIVTSIYNYKRSRDEIRYEILKNTSRQELRLLPAIRLRYLLIIFGFVLVLILVAPAFEH